MDIVSLVLLMLLLVVISGFVARMLPIAIPLPLVQIALGAAIAVFAQEKEVILEPDIFFLLFLPPLLFLDGWRIPKIGLFKDAGTILELSIGLVLFTVLGMGFFIHWMIPTISLPIAFALAAVISPTDPVAVAALAKRTPIPKRLMHILEGESLLNDASGLICLRFAIAAALTGTFSLQEAFLSFLWLAIGGVAIGVITTWSVAIAKGWLARRLGEESGTQILISLLIPFGAYILAEHLHCSGILAAVSAGITMSYVESTGQVMASTRIRRNVVWDTVQFAANGVIFVLLGEQLPNLSQSAIEAVGESGHSNEGWLILYVLAIVIALAVLRFTWVWVSVTFTMLRRQARGKQVQKTHWRIIAAMSVAGVRGAITLAGILTLPMAMPDGAPFPDRELAIFLAAGVIIISLIAASALLPPLMKGLILPPEPSHEAEEDMARITAARAAIKAVEEAHHTMAEGRTDADLYTALATRVMDDYRKIIDGTLKTGQEKEQIRRSEVIERKLHLVALKAERDELFRLVRKRKIEDDVMRKLVREIDLLEARYNAH